MTISIDSSPKVPQQKTGTVSGIEPGDYHVPNLAEELTSLLAQIPHGRVTTYGDLADALGSRRAARWVGEYLLDHDHSDECRCHRVVRHEGELGRYVTGDVGDKSCKLQQEGIKTTDGIVDLSGHRFRAFTSKRPLDALTQLQEHVATQVCICPFPETPELVAGVDVSYVDKNRAVGAYVLVETESGNVVWSTTACQSVEFPYISGYLAFREIGILRQLVTDARSHDRQAELLFVDGNGLLHHRNAGIATYLGVLADQVTIGVGKKLLCGNVNLDSFRSDETRPVTLDGRTVAMAMKARDASRPIFVSPGQLIDVADAARLARCLFHGHRLPEPLYWADRLSRQVARQIAADEQDQNNEEPC